MLGDKIRQWKVLEKSGHTYRQTHRHPQIITWIVSINEKHNSQMRLSFALKGDQIECNLF